MNGKRIVIGTKPPASPEAEAWVRMGEGADAAKRDLYTARL
ncbi:MAG TPA: chromosome partitioning protein ParB, partial [Burkholderiales bacterium]|nr:chromosome partitioning protein ParB [Burkholderiales bacterium]